MQNKKTKRHGLFITFDGLGGVGKSTQCKMLFNYLQKNTQIKTITTSETDTNSTHISSNLIEFTKNVGFEDSVSDLFSFLLLRREHLKKVIIPSLSENKIVLCDRFTDSTVAYQGYGANIDINLINKLNNLACSFDDFLIKPDVTFILDRENIESDAINRSSHKKRFNTALNNNKNFFTNVKNGFLHISKSDTHYILINNSDTEEKIHEIIKLHVNNIINRLFN